MTRYQKQMTKFMTGVVPYAAIAGTTAVLLVLEPHLSCTMIVMALTMVMLFTGGIQMRWIVVAVLLAGIFIVNLSEPS
jgi:cell division protein FtsW (lipid II flippase)